MIRNMRIGKKFGLIVAAIMLLAVFNVIGMSEMAKAGYFTSLERDHMELVMMMQNRLRDLERVAGTGQIAPGDGLLTARAEQRERMGLEMLAEETAKRPAMCLDRVSAAEEWLFRLAGFGAIIDICRKDVSDNAALAESAAIFRRGGLTQEQLIARLPAHLDAIRENSLAFAVLMPQVRSFVSTAAIAGSVVISLLALSFVVCVAGAIKRDVIFTRESIERIERDQDLSCRIPVPGNDEIGDTCRSINRMLEQFESIVLEISVASRQLAASARGMSASSAKSSGQIDKQRAEIIQIANAMEEMACTVQHVANTTNSASGAAENAYREAESGGKTVAAFVESVRLLEAELRSANDVVTRFHQDSESIGMVLDVIRDLAEQTNLLALNAAIEAARAGEQGRGFAVVADEVRLLASRTQKSTEDIQAVIRKLQGGVKEAAGNMAASIDLLERGVSDADLASNALATITEAAALIRDMSVQIAGAAHEQSQVATEMERSVQHISQGADLSAQEVQLVNGIAAEVAELSGNLDLSVSRFKVCAS